MEKKSKVHDLKNEDEPIREILGKVPRWIVRWGNTLILLLFISIVSISIIIKYPESIYTKAILVSINAPKPVVNFVAGKIISLKVSESDTVTKGQILGFIESTANHKQILELENYLDSLDYLLNTKIESFPKLISPDNANLGELQQAFQTFAQAFILFRNYLSDGFYLRKKSMLTNDLMYLKKSYKTLLQQKELNEQDLTLSQKTFEANQSLKDDKVISDLDYRNEASKLIDKKLTLPQVSSAIITNEGQQNEKQKEIMELENTIAQQKNIFQQSLNTFKSQLEDWEKKYILIAPISGKISFPTFIQENQQLQPNQVVCYINPSNSKYYVETYIPQTNFGKVNIGQKVILRFPSYPYQEYGLVYGSVEFISKIGTDSGYFSKIKLNNQLLTSYNKKLQYRDGLVANTEIITKDMSLLERFYYNIIKLVKK